MTALKSGIAALILLAGLSGTARAQQFVAGNTTFPGAGTNLGFATFNGGFVNYGVPAIYPIYPGFGAVGYGAGTGTFGAYSTQPYLNAPQVQNNMGGLMGAIQKSTGKPGSYRNSPYSGVTRRVR